MLKLQQAGKDRSTHVFIVRGNPLLCILITLSSVLLMCSSATVPYLVMIKK